MTLLRRSQVECGKSPPLRPSRLLARSSLSAAEFARGELEPRINRVGDSASSAVTLVWRATAGQTADVRSLGLEICEDRAVSPKSAGMGDGPDGLSGSMSKGDDRWIEAPMARFASLEKSTPSQAPILSSVGAYAAVCGKVTQFSIGPKGDEGTRSAKSALQPDSAKSKT
jgi:hypothetical protein